MLQMITRLETNPDLMMAERAFLDDRNPAWATFIKDLPGYDLYKYRIVEYVRSILGNEVKMFTAMSRSEYEAVFLMDASKPLVATLREYDAKADALDRNVLCLQMIVDPSVIIMRGRPEHDELVIDSSLVLKSRILAVVTKNL